MAVREILKYPQVESIVLVDLDPRMTELFAQSPLLRELNADALASPKLKIVNADALQWLEASQDVFDYVVADFPDPVEPRTGQALLDRLLPPAQTACRRNRPGRGAGHLAAVCPAKLLDRGRHAGSRRLEAPRPTTRWCPASANGATSSPASATTGRRRRYRLQRASLPRMPCRRCSTSPPTWRACPAEPNRLDNQNLVRVFEREWGRVQAH
jgi:spermidine synthase